MSRVNVFLGERLLERIDAEARLRRMKRSALVREALEEYLEARRRAREEREARLEMEESCREMDRLAERLGEWDATAVIREFRDARHGAVAGVGRGDRGKKR